MNHKINRVHERAFLQGLRYDMLEYSNTVLTPEAENAFYVEGREKRRKFHNFTSE